jgi:tetratricopeptide (TPR) repeat protein
MSGIIELFYKGMPVFITDMVARGFWWAILANVIFQAFLGIFNFVFVFTFELIFDIIAKKRGKTREKEPVNYSNPYINLLGLLFPFYIWHIRHGVGWLIYAIAVTVFAVILMIYRLNKKDKGAETNNASAYVNRGKEHANNKDYDSAVADFNEAVRINPNDASVYFYRGNAYINKNDYSNAIVDYSLAIKINPNDASSYNNRGCAYEAIGDKQRALTDYQSAAQLNPNETLYRDNLKRIMGL